MNRRQPKSYPNNGPSLALQLAILRPSPSTRSSLTHYSNRRTTRPETRFAILNMTRPSPVYSVTSTAAERKFA
jgi:hypothetical protein